MPVCNPGQLAALLATGEPWAGALAALAYSVHAQASLVIASGPPARRLAAGGEVPASLGDDVDETAVSRAFATSGMWRSWVRTIRVGNRAVGLVALATRDPDGLSVEERAELDELLPVLALALRAVAVDDALRLAEEMRKRVEARTLEIERHTTLGAVAAAVAHDLAAPISALVMEVADILDRISDLEAMLPGAGPGVRNAIDDLRGLADHCTDATERARQLLSDFRLAAHPTPPEVGSWVAVQIGDALRACVRLIAPLARNRVRIDLVIEPGLPVIPGSRRRLEQAFVNLLVNAVHAASVREGMAGVVEARARRTGEEILVEIIDNGIGIPADVKARIFEPFFTTKAPDVGTGLGLPITRDLVQAHGGIIEVESEEGRGACFRVRLPVTAVPAREAPAVARPRILIVDDDEGVARALERSLRSEYQVSCASTGRQALEILETGAHFGALIVDLSMPDIGGVELFQRIRKRWPGLENRIIFGTGGAFTPATKAFLASIPNRRFEKPITREELGPIVRSVVSVA